MQHDRKRSISVVCSSFQFLISFMQHYAQSIQTFWLRITFFAKKKEFAIYHLFLYEHLFDIKKNVSLKIQLTAFFLSNWQSFVISYCRRIAVWKVPSITYIKLSISDIFYGIFTLIFVMAPMVLAVVLEIIDFAQAHDSRTPWTKRAWKMNSITALRF